MKNFIITATTFALLFSFISLSTQAQRNKRQRKGEFYFSWGYNKEWYTNSTIKISQPSLANHYKLVNVKGHDHPGWDEGLFGKAISIPQYNYRLGLFINRKKRHRLSERANAWRVGLRDKKSYRIAG